VRKSVSLSREQLTVLGLFRTPGTPEHTALAELTGADPATNSEAETLRSLFELAYRTVRDAMLDIRYAEVAAMEDDEGRHARLLPRERLLATAG
jgi:hypothetical protein